MNSFDLAIIGSGPGGYRAAVIAALRGLKVAVVEQGTWGGTCLNRGCVPKKAWYSTARLIAAAGGFAARGIKGELAADIAAAWTHQHAVVGRVRASYTDYLQRLGVRLIQGEARFHDAATVVVGGERHAAGHVIVATGSTPRLPRNVRGGGSRVLTTDDLFDRPPPSGRRVAVIGSGVIGTEFAFILALLGLDVLWLTQHEPLGASGYSVPARGALAARLAEFGIRARTASRVVSVEPAGERVTLTLPDGARETVDWALLGAGRDPNTAGLALDAAGVACEARGFVRVDDERRTTARSVYAVGDVANPAMTSNHALADAAVAVGNIIEPGSRRSDARAVPQVVYSALELARIGLSEDEAEANGLEPATGFTAFESSPAGLAEDDARGFVRIVAELETGRLLGAEIVGAAAGELVHLVGLEFGTEAALGRLAGMAYNHPARAEEILNAVETLAARWGLKDRIFV